MTRNLIPGLEEITEDGGREAEVDHAVVRRALCIPISGLHLAPVVAVEPDANVRHLIGEMFGCQVTSTLVLEDGKLVGIVTERDILRKLGGMEQDLTRVKVREIMTSRPRTLSPRSLLVEAIGLMLEGGFRRVPVLDDSGVPIGILCTKNIIDRLVEFFPEEVWNLPPRPPRCSGCREGA
ncbi:MAG: CBS domain-containing protein [Planctomycetes bacterium]|nr:CBS domain-containing protein [Planctomycetota bacterium]